MLSCTQYSIQLIWVLTGSSGEMTKSKTLSHGFRREVVNDGYLAASPSTLLSMFQPRVLSCKHPQGAGSKRVYNTVAGWCCSKKMAGRLDICSKRVRLVCQFNRTLRTSSPTAPNERKHKPNSATCFGDLTCRFYPQPLVHDKNQPNFLPPTNCS